MLIRRTLEELEARYFLEPELQDVIVEGVFDRDVISIVLSENGDTRTVYDIDTVDIPPELLAHYGYTSGNKQRVMVLALVLANTCSDCCRYVCLVDKDLDHWLDRIQTIRNLRWSKYASLDAHFYNEETMQRLLILCGKAQVDDVQGLFKSLGEVLGELYLLRAAGEVLGLEFKWPDFTKSLSINDGDLRIDIEEFKTKLLNKSGLAAQREAVDAEIDRLFSKISGDLRNRIRGHDLIYAVAWILKKTKGFKAFATPEAIQRLFVLEAPKVQDIYAEITVT